MKAKKLLALLLTLAMIFSLFPAVVANADGKTEEDPLSISDAEVTTLKPHLDGEEISVTWYYDSYLSRSNSEEQMVNVYVPENATAASPIILFVNNGGWMMNSYAGCTKVENYSDELITDRNGNQYHPGDYSSTSDSDKVGAALAAGYVVVSYGCRGRSDGLTDGEYLGHSPATMTDTKAVVRWLRYNDAAIRGDAERIVVTGTSGGGALSTVIAASGNSPDYFASLYEVGAAGIDCVDGEYVSTIGDDVWGVIAYCPITDLGNACAAYEWMYNATRYILDASGDMNYSYNPNGGMGPSDPSQGTPLDNDYLLGISDELVGVYEEYLNGLGLEAEDGTPITSENFAGYIEALMRAEIEESIQEIGIEQMRADIAAAGVDVTWLTIEDDGNYTYEFDKHLEWLARKQTLKVPSAFSNYGLMIASQNEDNLFGTKEQEYSPFNEYSWNNDARENTVGLDDTGLTWDEYMETDAGKAQALQMKMTSAVAYLTEGTADSAPNWYVRHGMADRDTSFAVEASLYFSALNNEKVEDLNFEFAWLKPHQGDYDIQEAFAWLAEQVAEDTDPLSVKDATKSAVTPKLDGEDIVVDKYTDVYVSDPNRPEDQLVDIYVPEGADENSPILLLVDNAGWQSDSYASNAGIKSYGYAPGFGGQMKLVGDYSSTNDAIGVAIKNGYVVVSFGARSRSNGMTDGEYLGHSPATMTDTKAVIRYLRYNADLLPAGNPERIIVSGTSGGGALSTVIAASGNSPDYFESLYEIGAAGIDYVDGEYVSTIGDDVFAVIAWCPITDLGNACAAYEWMYNATREILNEIGAMSYEFPKGTALDNDELLSISEALIPVYVEYFNKLGLVDENGETITTDNLAEHISALMEKEIEESIEEYGVEQMRADIAAAGIEEKVAGNVENGTWTGITVDDVTWLVLNDDGTYEYDFNKHLLWLALKQTLKVPSAFSNYGLEIAQQNEDNLFGTREQEYSPFNEYSWNNDKKAGNGVGLDDTNLTWDEYMATPEGEALALQIRMTSAPAYLNEGTADTAPYWYVRHGMADRDTSFAVETTLYYSALSNEKIEDLNFEFAWLQPHAGNYDIPEAYAWLAEALAAAEEPEPPVVPVVPVDPGKPAEPADGSVFDDVDADDWFYNEVMYCYENGLMEGTGNRLFQPGVTVTRAMAITTLYRLAGSPAATGSNSFTDLTQNWYKDAVQWGVNVGVTNGVSATEFAPNASITREQLATMLWRFAKSQGVDVSVGENTNILSYADAGEISEYAIPAMQWACGSGLFIGESADTLNPQGLSSRAVLATVLMRYCETIK